MIRLGLDEWIATRGAVMALLLTTPAVASARGEQLLFLFMYFPFLAVMTFLVIRLWTWKASRAAKLRSFAAVGFSAALIFALNREGEGLAIVMPLGGPAFLVGIAVQFLIPAFVWRACRRREERRQGCYSPPA